MGEAALEVESIADRWALPLGRLLLALGEIEHVTADAIKSFASQQGTGASHVSLARRLDIMRDTIVNRPEFTEVAFEIGELIEQVKPLLPLRNMLAHNPVVIGIYQSSDVSEFQFAEEVVDQGGKLEPISHAELSKYATDAQIIATQLSKVYWALPRVCTRNF
jgi:hypothetical protein